jgi:phosphoglycerol transferase MdoB-like AlkP superfamily enzyme
VAVILAQLLKYLKVIKMKKNLQFLTLYFSTWLLVFWVGRAAFLCYHFEKTKMLSFAEIVGSFTHGFSLDLSFICYLLFPAILLLCINHLFSTKYVLKIVTHLILFFVLLLIFGDMELYKAWNFRIDNTFFVYLKNPKEMTASVSSSPVFLLSFLFILVYTFFVFIFSKVFYNFPAVESEKWTTKSLSVVLLLAFGASLIVPIRGGIQQIPINQSRVYFSTNQFANHAAINPLWNFFDSIVQQKGITENPYLYLKKEEAQQIIDSLYTDNQPFEKIIKKDILKPNVIIIVWETLTSKVVESLGGLPGATPNFDRLSKEGILFTHAFASGDRTDKGIVAVLSAFPAQPIASIVQEPKKAEKLPILSKSFRQNGYNTSFFYGGELAFAGMQSYLINGEFEHLITKNNFSKAECSSKWGAFDHIVYQKMASDLATMPQPFFSTILTLTSHEPFEIPEGWAHEIYGKASDEVSRFANSQYYADAAFGKFIDEAKKQTWWQNTLIVVVGDHGARLIDTKKVADNFKTPILWLGGALNQQGILKNDVVSQLDIAHSLLAQCDIDAKKYTWSKNMFSSDNQHFAYASFKNGFGFFNNEKQIIFDNVGKQVIENQGAVTDDFLKKGKALQQMTFEDYLK